MNRLMNNAPRKLVVFALGLAVVFAAAFSIGATLGPDRAAEITKHSQSHEHQPKSGSRETAPDDLMAGLASTEAGYMLQLAQSRFEVSEHVPLRFQIIDETGAPVTNYTEHHEKQLHLIVVRRDMIGFQHVHPTLDPDGTWSIPVDLRAGDYRVFADFVPADGNPLTLGADVHVAGQYDPQLLPPPAPTATVDGYTVSLSGSPIVGETTPLTLSVSRDGKPVTDLQPYLGAYGHLVVLRASDLAYLHVHPMDQGAPGPAIGFETTIPSAGDYRLFLDFKHGDVVRTAEFTVSIDQRRESIRSTPPAPAHDGDGH